MPSILIRLSGDMWIFVYHQKLIELLSSSNDRQTIGGKNKSSHRESHSLSTHCTSPSHKCLINSDKESTGDILNFSDLKMNQKKCNAVHSFT